MEIFAILAVMALKRFQVRRLPSSANFAFRILTIDAFDRQRAVDEFVAEPLVIPLTMGMLDERHER